MLNKIVLIINQHPTLVYILVSIGSGIFLLKCDKDYKVKDMTLKTKRTFYAGWQSNVMTISYERASMEKCLS